MSTTRTAPDAVTLRRLASEDPTVAAVGDLVADVYGGEGHAGGSYLDVLRDAATRAATAELVVAQDGAATLLGTVTFVVAPHRYAGLARPGEAEFRMLAVAPGARRRGIARLLVTHCVDRAVAEGAPVLRLTTFATMTAAMALYESMGFVRTPELDHPATRDHAALPTYARHLT